MVAAELFETSTVDLGLYIELVEGGQLDLRAAARAALAFDSLVRDFAEAAGLEDDFELNLIEGERGSLHLKAVLASIKDKVKLGAVAMAVMGFIGGMAADELRDYVREQIRGVEEVELTPEAVDEIASAVAVKCESPAAREHLQQMTKALKSDEDVTGVGATVGVQDRPALIRPRSDFTIEPGELIVPPELVEVSGHRIQILRETVILTEPVLTTEKKRKWRVIREAHGEIQASMEDESFWEKLVAGQTGLPMSGGIHLDVELEVKSERDPETGLWKDRSYRILSVEDWRSSPAQTSLFER